MAVSIFTSQTPTLPDTDGSLRTLAMKMSVSASGHEAFQGRVWVPTGGLPATVKLWQLWNFDAASKLHEFDLSVLGTPTENTWSPWVDLSAPVPLTASVNYAPAQHIQGSPGYVYADGVPAPLPIVNGIVTATTALYQNGGGSNTLPNTEFAGYFFVDVNIREAATGRVFSLGPPAAVMRAATW